MLAGAMVFLMAALWIMFKPDSQPASTPLYQMAEAYNTPLPPGLQQRGGADQVEATEAIQAYANESYKKALKLFQAKANPTKADQLYLSNCLIQLGKYGEAKTALSSITLSDNDKYKNDVNWYLAIAALGLEDKTGAQDILKNIVQDSDNIYKSNAEKLLKELKKQFLLPT